MSVARASILGIVDWLLAFVTVPLALALIVFPLVWGPRIVVMLQDFDSALPALTEWVLDGALSAVWGMVSIAVGTIACAMVRTPLRARRGMLIAALLWACLGVGLIWLAVYLPLFELVENVSY